LEGSLDHLIDCIIKGIARSSDFYRYIFSEISEEIYL